MFAAFLFTAVTRPGNFTGDYNASSYWVTYEDGFVRRGLPGTLLAALLGHPPGRLAATVMGFVLVALACGALVWLTRLVIRETVPGANRVVVATVVIASPFTFALVMQNRGRYDAVVLAALVAVVALFRPGVPRALRYPVIAVIVAVAVASEEFALAFLAPPVLLGILLAGGPWWRQAGRAALALVPVGLVALASATSPPTFAYLTGISRRATDAGLALDPAQEDSISALGQGWRDGLAVTLGMSPLTIGLCALVLGGTAVMACAVLVPALGVDRRWATAAVAVVAAGALGLSAFGPDYRRWWGLAFVAMVACLLILATVSRERPAPAGAHRRAATGALTAAVLVVSAGVQLFPVWPTWDPGANTPFSLDHLAAQSGSR